MAMRQRTVVCLLVLFSVILIFTSSASGAEPSNCSEMEKKAEALGERVEGLAESAGEAADRAKAERTFESMERAKGGAERLAAAADEAADLAKEAEAMACYKAQAMADTARRAAEEAREEVAETVNLVEGLKPRFLDPGTPEYERYQQDKDEVSPSR